MMFDFNKKRIMMAIPLMVLPLIFAGCNADQTEGAQRADTTPSPMEFSAQTQADETSPTPIIVDQPEVEPPGNLSPEILIPAGPFEMGCFAEIIQEEFCPGDQIPGHTVFLDAFYIDQTEVTNAQYALCVNAGVCNLPASPTSFTRDEYFNNQSFENFPVIWVDWFSANTYCEWAGKRLPTEAEWEKAARGSEDMRPYSWGFNEPGCSLLNFGGDDGCVGDTSAVGSFPDGASPYEVLDLGGNVIEWVNDWYDGAYYEVSPENNPQGPETGESKVVRGDGWRIKIEFEFVNPHHLTTRNLASPTGSGNGLGFRCARTP